MPSSVSFLDTLFCWGKCRPQEIKCLLFKVSIKDQSVFNSLKLNSLLNQYFKYVPRSLSNTKPPKVIRNFFLKMDVCFSGIIQLGLFRWNGEPSTWESSWHSGAYVRFVCYICPARRLDYICSRLYCFQNMSNVIILYILYLFQATLFAI